jgi:hypothetical protein
MDAMLQLDRKYKKDELEESELPRPATIAWLTRRKAPDHSPRS